MSTEKMREEFEEWAAKHKHNLNRDGVVVDYACRYTDLAWNSWQASRASIEVDLTVLDITHDTDTNHEPCGGDLFHADQVKSLIESLGLKVNPC